ncbi:MAG: phosphoenolpyruvate--protein phosphotransferase [Treponema sp.]|jgi:phosphotransferase system enzyme I (PtsI)|nr:phosphoenolpyruvate--protein phosphotransferase [Treponema sp.]
MMTLTGIPVSGGVALAQFFIYREDVPLDIPRFRIQREIVQVEWDRFCSAVDMARIEIEVARSNTLKENNEILDAHLLMLEDPVFSNQVKDRLEKQLLNIECAVSDTTREIVQKLATSPVEYFRERAMDIADVAQRILRLLLEVKRETLADLTKDVIVIARDILPSDMLTMNKERVKGIALDAGSKTSHAAILAKTFGIPAVVGLSRVTQEALNRQKAGKNEKNTELVFVNGETGEVVFDLSDRIATYKTLVQDFRNYRKKTTEFMVNLPAETLDGRRVTLNANIEIPEGVEQALACGAEGIGLYRSEFLFLTSGQPAEEEAQFNAYCKVIKEMDGRPVTIRTIDIGGDKVISNMVDTVEKNPLLGARAIRFSLAFPEIFKTQLRAILRSSIFGDVRIMFPMISCAVELRRALFFLEEAKDECRKRGQTFAKNIAVGCMIEVPAAAEIADILAEDSAFFSIGTNDLIQYSLAVDRNNELVNYLAQPFHPAVLRFIKKTIDAAHSANIKASMCGELAGDASATALLLGMGLDEFSMAASSIPRIKKVIRTVSMKDCRILAEKVRECKSDQEVKDVLERNKALP